MKIYISKKSELYLKWGYLFIGIPLYSIGAVAAMHDYIYINKPGALFGVIMLSAIAGILFYSSFFSPPSVLLIDDDKIILKGLWREIKYSIEDFKEVVPHNRVTYKIVFKDNKSYWFSPKIAYGYMNMFVSRKEKVSIINQQINEIKAHYRDKHSL